MLAAASDGGSRGRNTFIGFGFMRMTKIMILSNRTTDENKIY